MSGKSTAGRILDEAGERLTHANNQISDHHHRQLEHHSGALRSGVHWLNDAQDRGTALLSTEPNSTPSHTSPQKPASPSDRGLGVSDGAYTALQKFENIMNDPVGRINSDPRHNHYTAARREAAGEVVAWKSPGVPYDHAHDLTCARNGLDKIRRVLEREIDDPPDTLTDRGIEVLISRRKQVIDELDRLNGFLHRIRHG